MGAKATSEVGGTTKFTLPAYFCHCKRSCREEYLRLLELLTKKIVMRCRIIALTEHSLKGTTRAVTLCGQLLNGFVLETTVAYDSFKLSVATIKVAQ